MKKVLLSMAAAACALCTFAQDANVVLPDSVWITPYAEEGVTLNSVNDTVTIHMDKVPSVPVTIMFVTGNGFGIDMKYIRKPVETTSFDLVLSRENWGVPFNEEFFMNLGVTFTYGEGDDIEYYLNDEGEPVIGEAMFMTHDNGQAQFVRSYPTGEWEKYYTFADAYDEGSATLYFTKEVNCASSIGEITYYLSTGDKLYSEITDHASGWSDWDGLYTVTFPLAMADLKASEIEAIEVNFFGISNSEGEIEVPFMELENTTLVAPKQIQKKSKGLSLINGSDSNDVYTLQGIQIMKSVSVQEINNLPAGMYIINGKKVSVR